MLIGRGPVPADDGWHWPNTFGEWNKWEYPGKKMAGMEEDPSKALE
jgi:hypothetical protein